MSDIVIGKVKALYGWFGNMSPHTVTYEGVTYPRAEHLFQALRFNCEEIRKKIREVKNPMSAKMLCKKLQKTNADKLSVTPLSDEDLTNMALVLRLKIEQHPLLRTALLETDDNYIVEDCTKRQRGSGLFWGAARQADGTWKGDNWLGALLMNLRSELNEEVDDGKA